MDTDQIIKECLEKQERRKQLQIMQLRNNLKTFTHKELKKEIIKMKADKFAVTCIITYHYLFPHLLTKQGSKRSSLSKNALIIN